MVLDRVSLCVDIMDHIMSPCIEIEWLRYDTGHTDVCV